MYTPTILALLHSGYLLNRGIMRIVKIKYLAFLFCLVILPNIFYSCSKEDSTALIRVQIEGNTDEPIRCYGVNEESQNGLVIRGFFETSYTVKKPCAVQVRTRCNDPNTLITIKIWVNGKMKNDVKGNKFLDGYVDLR